jgi:ribonucleoside-triphosphate reductase
LATGQQKDGRGNICPATIILPTLAMEAKKKAKNNPEYIVDYFMDILEKAIGDCKDELIERFNWISIQSPASAKFMYENGTMYGYKESEGIRSALKHGTLAIGQIGLAETLQILIGCDQTEERGMALAKQIEQLFKDKCAEYKEHYKLNFGVYYTPAENLCFTAFKKFKKKYGEIKNVTYSDIEGKEDSDVKDHREFFTNSMHVPVWKKMDPFEKIDIESQLTGYSSAGCITYVELDDRTQNNLKALEQIVDYAMEKDIPYFAINVPADTCTCCGYQGSIDNECPVCGARDVPGKKVIQRLRRVTGYLTGDFETAFNLGKQDEVKHRYKHSESLVDWNNTSDQEA